MSSVIASHACLCEWTVAWAPGVQTVFGMRGGYPETAEALFLGELLLAVPLVLAMAFGRWATAALVLALAAGLPFALSLGLFGADLGQGVLTEGRFQLAFLCGFVLAPAVALGGLLRLGWCVFRGFVVRAPVDCRI